MKHLLAVSLGPVQDFIAQARRTRDLWYGSYLLSEMSRCAAEALARDGGALIFPCTVRGELPDNVANKILVEVPGDAEAAAVKARDARDAAMNRLRDLAEHARCNAGGLLDDGRMGFKAVWTEQVDTFVEFNAAWVAYDNGHRTYSEARRLVEKALAGRKSLRDFERWNAQTRGVKRSTLDGVRETLLRERDRPEALVRKYRLSPGEELDAIGITRRMGGDPKQFVPITTLALASWITTAEKTAGEEMEVLRSRCTQADVTPVHRPDLGWTAAFPFEAQVLLRDRWASLAKDNGLSREVQADLEGSARAVLRKMPPPHPYVACLVADGDSMGATLDGLTQVEDHRRLSQKLAAFAAEARAVVEQEHKGLLVFSGGDDVLAFVTLADALPCASRLRELFMEKMAEAVRGTGAAAPTLSVGLGVGHLMEDMSMLLELGREAEKLAKGDALASHEARRDAVAVVVDKRAGTRVSWRARWNSGGENPLGRMKKDADLLREALSTRKVYEIKRTLGVMPAPGAVGETEAPGWARLLCLEIERSLARVDADSTLTPAKVGLAMDPERYERTHTAVHDWVRRMLVAVMFAAAVPGTRRDGRD